jgi:hypothetical protein
MFPAGGGGLFTFDDSGFTHLALQFAGLPIAGPIKVLPDWYGTWNINPVTWCKERLDNCHPVGIHIYWGTPWLPMGPGVDGQAGPMTQTAGAHCVTLWEIVTIDPTTHVITLTDSDDNDGPGVGTQLWTTIWNGTEWLIPNYKPDQFGKIYMASAPVGDDPTATESGSWGGVKALFR